MLLKWLLLLLIAWYASKALGNIILTLRGIPIDPPRPTMTERERTSNISKRAEKKVESPKPREIEDARFEDL